MRDQQYAGFRLPACLWEPSVLKGLTLSKMKTLFLHFQPSEQVASPPTSQRCESLNLWSSDVKSSLHSDHWDLTAPPLSSQGEPVGSKPPLPQAPATMRVAQASPSTFSRMPACCDYLCTPLDLISPSLLAPPTSIDDAQESIC